MREKLKALGLSHNEQEVYISLLKIGETSVGDIIKDVNAHRQSVYNALEELEDRGLILKNQKNRVNHYKIANPNAFAESLKEKELIAKQLAKEVAQKLSKSKHEHEITVYDGRDRIRKYFLDRYKKMAAGTCLYVISNYADKFEEVLGKEFTQKKYNQLMLKRKIKVKIVSGQSKRKEFNEFLNRLQKSDIRKIKYIPDEYMTPIAIEITPNGVNFISFKKDWFIVEIRNQEIKDSYLMHFNLLWKIAKT